MSLASRRATFRPPCGGHRIAAMWLVCLAGCSPAPPSPTSNPAPAPRAFDPPDYTLAPIVDEHERDAPRLRVVSAAPVLTELCCALGLRESLVGRTRYCVHPPGVEAIPSIGALSDTNTELLLKLRPDLVLVSGSSRSIIERLTPLNLRVESVPDESLADIFTALKRIGVLLGRERTAACLCQRIEADLSAVDRAHPGSTPRRVLLVLAPLAEPPAPPFAAGAHSYYDDLLRRAGHQNVVETDGLAFAPLALEFIVRSDPDVIIEIDPGGGRREHGDADALRAWGALAPMKAVREHRVHVLRGGEHFLPGPRVARTYAALRELIDGPERAP
ncbi:MAG: helical backbone metal receptor [Phycisphaerae bacterium]